jgi:hypothetical protein
MTKQGIRNQIIALLNRNDITNAIADIFIDQTVARIQRTLRIPPMEKILVYTATQDNQDNLVLPNDFLQIKNLYISSSAGSYTLQYKDLDGFLRYPDFGGSQPMFYTRIQGGLKIKPSPAVGAQTTMIYYGEIPDLVNDTDENFLSNIAPDLLVYGALTFACDYYVDDRKADYEAVFARIYAELEEQAINMEMNQEGAAIAPAYNYPEY